MANLTSLNITSKRDAFLVLCNLLDLLFPPLCLSCHEKCSTKYLCPNCWFLCQLPDPTTRCRHCFTTLNYKTDLCLDCRHTPNPTVQAHAFDLYSPASFLPLDAAEAMASFAYLLYIQLEWPTPNVLIPMPDTRSLAIAPHLASLLNCPLSRALDPTLHYKQEHLEEGLILLVFSAQNSPQSLQEASDSLSQSTPSKTYLLSLIEPVKAT